MLKCVTLSVAIGAFAWCGAAEAAVVTVSYAGFLSDGTDTNGVFDVGSSASLVGQRVVVTYRFDTARGTYTSGAGVQDLVGGSLYPAASPAIDATVTVNDHSVSFSAVAFGEISASSAFGVSLLSQNAQHDADTYAFTTLTASLGSIKADITAPLSASLGPDGSAKYALTFFSLDGGNISGDFYAQSVSISSVPLPSSLPLFGLAVLGLGATAVRRKRHAAMADRCDQIPGSNRPIVAPTELGGRYREI